MVFDRCDTNARLGRVFWAVVLRLSKAFYLGGRILRERLEFTCSACGENVYINDVLFSSLATTLSGGAIYLSGIADAELTALTFVFCVATTSTSDGGACFVSPSTVLIIRRCCARECYAGYRGQFLLREDDGGNVETTEVYSDLACSCCGWLRRDETKLGQHATLYPRGVRHTSLTNINFTECAGTGWASALFVGHPGGPPSPGSYITFSDCRGAEQTAWLRRPDTVWSFLLLYRNSEQNTVMNVEDHTTVTLENCIFCDNSPRNLPVSSIGPNDYQLRFLGEYSECTNSWDRQSSRCSDAVIRTSHREFCSFMLDIDCNISVLGVACPSCHATVLTI
jgi:hypothetical protein